MDELGRAAPTQREEASRSPVPYAALLAGYWAFGQYWGVWVILVADYLVEHDISYGRNGLLLTGLSLVAVATMAFLAPRLQGLPLRTTVPAALVSLAVGALATAFLSGGAIVLSFLIVGLGNGLIDVYLNIAAQRAEIADRKPVLQWMHASYALGGITGAASAALVHALDLDFRVGFVWVAVALLATAWWNLRTAPAERGPAGEGSTFSLAAFRRHPGLWVPALVVMFAFLVEGSMDTWSGLYLQDQLGASAQAAAFAFAGFSASLFLGRMFAGRALFGFGPRITILVAGFGAMAAGALAALAGSIVIVGVAFLLMGFAISAAAPAGFSLTEDVAGGDASSAITAVTTIGYTGFVWSPPIFGWIAEALSLRAAMTVIVTATVGIVISGLSAPGRRVR